MTFYSNGVRKCSSNNSNRCSPCQEPKGAEVQKWPLYTDFHHFHRPLLHHRLNLRLLCPQTILYSICINNGQTEQKRIRNKAGCSGCRILFLKNTHSIQNVTHLSREAPVNLFSWSSRSKVSSQNWVPACKRLECNEYPDPPDQSTILTGWNHLQITDNNHGWRTLQNVYVWSA